VSVTIWHNPRCSKSRQTLELLRENNIEPEIIEYLDQPPTEASLREVLKLLGRQPRELMRSGEAEFKDNNLADTSLSDDELIAAMARIPRLIERPVVLANGKAAVGRPPESVLEIL
jgi:arsenate reductase